MARRANFLPTWRQRERAKLVRQVQIWRDLSAAGIAFSQSALRLALDRLERFDQKEPDPPPGPILPPVDVDELRAIMESNTRETIEAIPPQIQGAPDAEI
jgi:hypothetical protein